MFSGLPGLYLPDASGVPLLPQPARSDSSDLPSLPDVPWQTLLTR